MVKLLADPITDRLGFLSHLQPFAERLAQNEVFGWMKGIMD
jgi:hypothetical protein